MVGGVSMCLITLSVKNKDGKLDFFFGLLFLNLCVGQQHI